MMMYVYESLDVIITRQYPVIHFQGLRKITFHSKSDGKPNTK
jgi:hypothetical protein